MTAVTAPAIESAANRRVRPGDLGLLGLAAVAVVIFAVAGIDRPVWQDDAFAVLTAREGFGLFAALRHDNNFPFYYVLLSLWMRVFGESEPALRALSVLFYLAGAGTVYALGAALYRNRRAALYAAVLYLANAQLIRQAQMVRMYTLLGFLAAASLLLYNRVFLEENPSRRWTAWYIAVNCLGMFTQVWFFFGLLGQFLCQAILLRRVKKFLVCAGISGAIFAVLWGPSFLDQLHNPSTHWMLPFRAVFLLDMLLQFGGTIGFGLIFLVVCAAALVVSPQRERSAFLRASATRVLLMVACACILTPAAVSMVKPIYHPGRYSTVLAPVLAVLVGAMLARLAPRPMAIAICGGLLITSAVCHVLERERAGDIALLGGANLPPGQSDRATAEYLLRHAAPGDAIVFTNLTRPAADYSFRRHGQSGRFVEVSFPAEMDRHPGWVDRATLLRDPDALAAEAARTAETLAATARSGHRIWMYCALPGVTDFLRADLDGRLSLVERLDRRGPFFSELRVYAAR